MECYTSFLALGDIHGCVECLKRIRRDVASENIEFVVSVGDFVSLRSNDVYEELEVLEGIFEELNAFGTKVFFVWGNRDIELIDYVLLNGRDRDRRKLKSIVDYVLKSKNLHELGLGERVEINQFLRITCDPALIDEQTIFVSHYAKKVITNALIHLEGHVHYGQIAARYLNLGFVYRDDLHGARTLLGLYWVITVERNEYVITFRTLGEDLKIIVCPLHSMEGVFIVPKHWKRCPVCYDPTKARFSSYSSRFEL